MLARADPEPVPGAAVRWKPGPHSAGRDEHYLVFTLSLLPFFVSGLRVPLKRVRIICGCHVLHRSQIGATSGATSVGGVMTSVELPPDCFYNEAVDDLASMAFVRAETASVSVSARDDATAQTGSVSVSVRDDLTALTA